MTNSIESKAKLMVSGLDPENEEESFLTFDRAIELFERRADCVGCKVAKPEPRHRISTRTIAIGALVVGLFLPPILPLDEIIGTASAFRGPAMGIYEISLETPALRIGEPLVVKVKSEYLRVCIWRWTQEWRTTNSRPVAVNWMPGSAHVIRVVTEREYAFPLPQGITPGNYVFHASATGECGHGDVAQVMGKDLPFNVTN